MEPMLNMKGFGKMICSLDKELRHGVVGFLENNKLRLLVISLKVRRMGKEGSNGKMDLTMKVIL